MKEPETILDTPQLHPLPHVAEFLAVTPETIRTRIKRRQIQARKAGNRLYITGNEVHRYIRTMKLLGRIPKEPK